MKCHLQLCFLLTLHKTTKLSTKSCDLNVNENRTITSVTEANV